MPEDDGLEDLYRKALSRRSDGPVQMLYCGVVEGMRGSIIVSGSSEPEGLKFVAQPLQPLRNLDDPVDAAALERLRREVVRTTHYVDYVWEERDE